MKKFINPELELIELEEKDVIVTSVVVPFDESAPEATPEKKSPAQSLNWTNLGWNNTNQ